MVLYSYIQLFSKKIGPGILYAGAAVGVSHLVNATQAGASFGTQLLIAVILIHILKYPFFQIATKYSIATGNTLLEGYQQLHQSALWFTAIFTLTTVFIIQAAVTLLTVGLLQELFQNHGSHIFWCCFLLISIGTLLILGSYNIIESFGKWSILLLTICTIATFLLSYNLPIIKLSEFMTPFSLSDKKHLFFLVVLLGWMPAPLDVAIWQSIWTVQKKKNTAHINFKQNEKNANIDFHFGYWLTMVLACMFLLVGNNLLYGTSEKLSSVGPIFAKQLIHFYTKSIGSWSYWIIVVSATATMLSTVFGCLNGFSNTLAKISILLFSPNSSQSTKKQHPFFSLSIIFVVIGTLSILIFSTKNMGQMIKIATTISFIATPIFAILNYLLVFKKNISGGFSLSIIAHIISILGILFFITVTIVYLKQIYFN